MKSRIMYMELKTHPGGHDDRGPARIGRVTFNRTGKTLTYRGKRFQRGGTDSCANYYDVDTREGYWISGPKKNGEDRHPCGGGPVEIDQDVREEYWTEIRKQPERTNEKFAWQPIGVTRDSHRLFSLSGKRVKSRIMYMELKTHPGGHNDRGPARIGRVTFNRMGKTLTYRGKEFQRGGTERCPPEFVVIPAEENLRCPVLFWQVGKPVRQGGACPTIGMSVS